MGRTMKPLIVNRLILIVFLCQHMLTEESQSFNETSTNMNISRPFGYHQSLHQCYTDMHGVQIDKYDYSTSNIDQFYYSSDDSDIVVVDLNEIQNSEKLFQSDQVSFMKDAAVLVKSLSLTSFDVNSIESVDFNTIDEVMCTPEENEITIHATTSLPLRSAANRTKKAYWQ
ncbi:hypothetical protein GJ496_003097 [Pomphorhynchus laevis]|nr:hypothetical protein GJ496_003097 [Pomphorhynchus laevis]